MNRHYMREGGREGGLSIKGKEGKHVCIFHTLPMPGLGCYTSAQENHFCDPETRKKHFRQKGTTMIAICTISFSRCLCRESEAKYFQSFHNRVGRK